MLSFWEKSFFTNVDYVIIGSGILGLSTACSIKVAAVNAFVKDLFPDLNVAPGRGHVLITTPIPGLKLKGVFHFDEGYYYFRNYENQVLLGGGRNLDFKAEETTSPEFNQMILEALNEFLSNAILQGQKFEIEQCWTGIMAFTEDKLPLIKRYDDRIIVAISCNGMGIALSSKIGEEISSLIP